MEDIDVDVIIAFSSAKPCLSVQFFEILILSRHFGETYIMSVKSTSFPHKI